VTYAKCRQTLVQIDISNRTQSEKAVDCYKSKYLLSLHERWQLVRDLNRLSKQRDNNQTKSAKYT